mmetsp:Transcript_56488/g.148293  ORF Transcript_56488/g.148293 Transcript_56488/m.148293 type:complete len:235 (+) Transcript_56488:690-1394(+)
MQPSLSRPRATSQPKRSLRSVSPDSLRMKMRKYWMPSMPDSCWHTATPTPTRSIRRRAGAGQASCLQPSSREAATSSASARAILSSAASGSPSPSRSSTSRASPRRPRCSSQRGDSGITFHTRRSITSGSTPPIASMSRQPIARSKPEKAKPQMKPRLIPTLVAISDHVTSRPRWAGGAISAMYTGSTASPKPTPSPTRQRPAISTPYDCETDITSTPTSKPHAATANALRRPI